MTATWVTPVLHDGDQLVPLVLIIAGSEDDYTVVGRRLRAAGGARIPAPLLQRRAWPYSRSGQVIVQDGVVQRVFTGGSAGGGRSLVPLQECRVTMRWVLAARCGRAVAGVVRAGMLDGVPDREMNAALLAAAGARSLIVASMEVQVTVRV